jgi:serine/threonine-protein kinase
MALAARPGDTPIPTHAPGYLRLTTLAAGGMGVVELCARRSGAFVRLLAVKRLHPHLRDDEGMRAMFLDEAKLAGLIRHANVVPVLDFGEDGEGPFLVMDYVEGLSLSRFVRHHAKLGARLPLPLCARIGAQIAAGLHAAHELVDTEGAPLLLVHRDVSPQNILLGHDGLVRVTDFGIAKGLGNATHTSTGLLKGKVGYMSPEQLRFEPIDRRSDLFALGVVLFELITSRRLYAGDDASEVARTILQAPTPDLGEDRPDAEPELVELLFELLAKQREDRPASAAEVAARLDMLSAGDGAVDLGGYIEAHFGAELDAERRRIQELVANLETPTTPTPSAIDGPRRRWWPLVLGAVIVATAASYVAWRPVDPAPVVTAPAPAEVTVHIDSQPPGATVTLAGAIAGVTPLRVEVPRGEVALPVQLELAGFTTTRHELVPIDDERLLIALTPAPTVARASPMEAAGPIAAQDDPDAITPTPAATATQRRSARRPQADRRTTTPASAPDAPPRFRRFQ